jgi:hypothetical protein
VNSFRDFILNILLYIFLIIFASIFKNIFSYFKIPNSET